jgi:hypothetical protein
MNAVTAGDLDAADVEAADLLALARFEDDGAPFLSSLPRSQPGIPYPDDDRGAQGRPRQQPTALLAGVG